jgi:hypothetical protein
VRLTHLLPRSVAVAALAALAVPAGASAAKPADRDHDRMPDRWERAHRLSTHRNDARKDADRDGLKNLAEFRAHTDPRDADTDDDGIKDGKERAGTIASLTDGVLTLTLFDGSTFAAKVDDRTEVECETPAAVPAPAPATIRHGDDDSGDDDAPGHDAGDDDAPATTPPAPTVAPAPAGTTTPAPAVDDHGTGDDDEGDDDHGTDVEDEQEDDCGVADLKPGARVDEAKIALTATGARFTKIELG